MAGLFVHGHRMTYRAGARVVVVDHRHAIAGRKANRWLASCSGTDMALALAMAQRVLAEGLHDKDFCENWIVGWQAWRDHLNTRHYTPEWAEPITSISAQEMRRLAREIAAADGCVMFASRGINHHTNSPQTNRVLMCLMAITGNWGVSRRRVSEHDLRYADRGRRAGGTPAALDPASASPEPHWLG